jgi:hypothetical protein
MTKILSVLIVAIILHHQALADDCTFTDDGSSLEEVDQCPSFVNADKAQMRFARIDSVNNDEVTIGPSRYFLAPDVEVFDPELFSLPTGNCISADGGAAVAAHVGNDVAMILVDGGQQDDRQIKTIWLLNCDIAQGR